MEEIAPGVWDVLARMPGAYAALASGSVARGFDGEWGPYECLAHVLEVGESVFRFRIDLMLAHNHPAIPSVDPARSARMRQSLLALCEHGRRPPSRL